jgi:hypothetical protein
MDARIASCGRCVRPTAVATGTVAGGRERTTDESGRRIQQAEAFLTNAL